MSFSFSPKYADEAQQSDSDNEEWSLARGRSRFEPTNERRQRSTHPVETAEEVEEEPILADVEDEEESSVPSTLPPPVPVVSGKDDARLRRLKDKVRYV